METRLRNVKNRDFVSFSVDSSQQITEKQALELQFAQGYPPQGYGFYNFKSWESDGTYYATWRAGSSCE